MAELEAEFEKNRAEIASYLREFANKLDSGSSVQSGTGDRIQESDETTSMTKPTDESSVQSSGSSNHEKVTLLVGNDSATVNPPETLSFHVAVDSDSSLMESGAEESVSFVLRWASEEVQADDELSVH